jgi:hypothetical protein
VDQTDAIIDPVQARYLGELLIGWADQADGADEVLVESNKRATEAESSTKAAPKDELREQYMQAIAGAGGCVDLTGAVDAVLAVRDTAMEQARDTLAALDQPGGEQLAVPARHVGGRVNAEDCPGCSGTNPAYPFPFICPGPADEETPAEVGRADRQYWARRDADPQQPTV